MIEFLHITPKDYGKITKHWDMQISLKLPPEQRVYPDYTGSDYILTFDGLGFTTISYAGYAESPFFEGKRPVWVNQNGDSYYDVWTQIGALIDGEPYADLMGFH